MKSVNFLLFILLLFNCNMALGSGDACPLSTDLLAQTNPSIDMDDSEDTDAVSGEEVDSVK